MTETKNKKTWSDIMPFIPIAAIALGNLFAPRSKSVPTDAPKFLEEKPWALKDFRVEHGKLLIDIIDSIGAPQTLTLPYDRIKLIQYRDQQGTTDMKVYAEVRRAPAEWYFQPPHEIIYLGDVSEGDWRRLQSKLKGEGVHTFWYQKPRREKTKDLAPKSWTPNVG